MFKKVEVKPLELPARIPYNLNLGKMILLILGALFLAGFMFFDAATNKKEIVIEHLIHLNQFASTVFLFLLGGFMAFGAVWMSYVAIKTVNREFFLSIDSTSMSVPIGVKDKTLDFRLSEIIGVQVFRENRPSAILINLGDRKAFIDPNRLSRENYEQVKKFLVDILSTRQTML